MNCEHPVSEVERVAGYVEWCRECGAYRTLEHWRSPRREVELEAIGFGATAKALQAQAERHERELEAQAESLEAQSTRALEQTLEQLK